VTVHLSISVVVHPVVAQLGAVCAAQAFRIHAIDEAVSIVVNQIGAKFWEYGITFNVGTVDEQVSVIVHAVGANLVTLLLTVGVEAIHQSIAVVVQVVVAMLGARRDSFAPGINIIIAVDQTVAIVVDPVVAVLGP
jgi:Na+/melibiose symporter-like transporter